MRHIKFSETWKNKQMKHSKLEDPHQCLFTRKKWHFDNSADHWAKIKEKRKDRQKNWHFVDFDIPADHWAKIKEKRKDRQILWSCQRAEKVRVHEGDGNTNCSWCTWNGHERLGKKTGIIGDKRKK